MTVLRVLVVGLFLFCSNTYAQTPLVLATGHDDVPVNALMSVAVDSSYAWTIDSVRFENSPARFRAAHGQTNFSYPGGALWVRIDVVCRDRANNRWVFMVDYAPIGEVQWFDIREGMICDQRISGLSHPFTVRAFHSTRHVFPFALEADDTASFYLRVRSQHGLLLPMRVLTLQNAHRDELGLWLFYGFLIGAFVALLLYNAVLYVTVQDKSYLLYVLYGLSFLIYYMGRENILAPVFLPSSPFVIEYVLIPLGAWGVLFFGSLFVTTFLDLKHRSKTLMRIMNGIAGISVIFLAIAVVAPALMSKSLSITGTIYSIVTLVVGIISWRGGNPAAPYYVTASLVFLAGIQTRVLRVSGLLESGPATEQGLPIGFLLEMVVLAIALGARINLIRDQKEAEKQELRTRFASDLHDDISGTLSGVSLALDRLQSLRRPGGGAGRRLLARISHGVAEAQDRLADIVWSTNPSDETWAHLMTKARRYAEDLFESVEIRYGVEIDRIPDGTMTMQQKHHVWLAFKEIVTNICRHSKARNVSIQVLFIESWLQFTVRDDGVGFSVESLERRSGIRNIERRIHTIGGTATLRTGAAIGTEWALKIPTSP